MASPPRIIDISLVSVRVEDVDESLAFRTEVLGFEPRDDVRPPLAPAPAEARVQVQADGGLPGVGLGVDDCRATHEDLRAEGAEPTQAPESAPPASRR